MEYRKYAPLINYKQRFYLSFVPPKAKIWSPPHERDFDTIKTNQRKRLSKRELNITQHYGRSRVRAGTN